MKRNYTLNLLYILWVVMVLVVYPLKNYSAIVNLNSSAESADKVEKPTAQQSTETLQSGFLFKY